MCERRARQRKMVPYFTSLDVVTEIRNHPGVVCFNGQLFWKVLSADLLLLILALKVVMIVPLSVSSISVQHAYKPVSQSS